MTVKKIIASLLTFVLLYACGSKSEESACPFSYFTKEFPKRNINFAHVLGSTFAIQSNKDTIIYAVYFNRKSKLNTIVDTKTKDTLFNGKISRYKGLFFLSEQQPDSTWHIQALKIKKNLIYGLNTMQQQMCWIDELVSADNVKTDDRKPDIITNSNFPYELTPVKKSMRKIYTAFIDSLRSDTLLTALTANNAEPIHYDTSELTEDSEEGSKVSFFIFPNPFKDELHIETSASKFHQLEIIDFNGLLIKKIDSLQKTNTLDLSTLKSGTYIVRITDSDYNTTVSKIIKE